MNLDLSSSSKLSDFHKRKYQQKDHGWLFLRFLGDGIGIRVISDIWRVFRWQNNDEDLAFFFFLLYLYTDMIEDTLSNSFAWKIICKGPDLASLWEIVFPCDIALPGKLCFLSCKVVDLRGEAPKSRRYSFFFVLEWNFEMH